MILRGGEEIIDYNKSVCREMEQAKQKINHIV